MIIFIYGEDTFRSKEKLKELKDKFIREVDPGESNVFVVDGKIASLEKINEKVSPSSLFAKKRMIIIEDLFLNKDKNILEDVCNFFKKRKEDSDDNIIIFWESSIKSTKKSFKKEAQIQGAMIDASGREKPLLKKAQTLFHLLMRGKYTQEFKQLSNTEAASWVKKEIESRGGLITNQASQILVGLAGNDLWRINNEIDKLINYKLGSEPKLIKDAKGSSPIAIEMEDVKNLVKGNFDENIFALTDAISVKNKSLASKLIEEQFDAGLTDFYLINMIVKQFKVLLRIRQAVDSGLTPRNITSLLKIHPFVVQKGINQVRNFDLLSLKNILSKLVKIDCSIKTGRGDARTMLNLLIIKM